MENAPDFDLKNQLVELSQRLQKSERERDEFRKKMEEAIEDKEQTFRRLEMMSSSHESRITEMHCVIAELSKKLRNKQDNVIMEETEVEGSGKFFFKLFLKINKRKHKILNIKYILSRNKLPGRIRIRVRSQSHKSGCRMSNRRFG